MAGEPARGYSWPPFQPGHELSIRHGIWSKRTTDPIVNELVVGVLATHPWLERFPEALLAWGRAEARCILLDEYVQAEGLMSERASKVLRFVGQFEREAREHRRTLGLDPRSEAELAREAASAQRATFDLEAHRARGRALLAARGGGEAA